MSSSSSAETLQQLRENAEKTAKDFGISYCVNIAWTVYERAKEAAETKEPDNLKLTYREFDSVIRTDLLTGYVDVKEGEGPGAMSGWKKVYCVERNDYGIEFYPSRGAYERHKKPKTTIQPAGYTVLTRDIARPFRRLIEPIATRLDVDPHALDGMVNFPHDSWALFHPQRTKYVFRICKASRFQRRKKQPVSAADEQIDRNEWIYFLKTCARKAKPRNTDTVLGMAFERTCKNISGKVDALKNWKDNGTEDEMLLEMLMTSCLPSVQDITLDEIKGRLSIPMAPLRSFASIIASRVLIPMWYKAVGLIKKTIQKVLGPAWTKIQEEARTLLDKLEPRLRRGLTPITTVHNKVLDAIKKATNKTMGQLLAKHVTPSLESFIEAYAKPLTDGFSYVRELYWTAVLAVDVPKDSVKRKDYLDAIPRKRSTMQTCYSHAVKLTQGLDRAKRNIEGTLKMIEIGSQEKIKFNGTEDGDADEEDEEDLCSEAEDSLLKVLDAAVNTLSLRLESGEQLNDDLVEDIITKQLDDDVIQLKRDVVKKGIRQFVLKYFRIVIDTNGELSQAIGSVDALIPSEMQDILGVQIIFDGFIEVVVGEPIDRMVEGAKIFK